MYGDYSQDVQMQFVVKFLVGVKQVVRIIFIEMLKMIFYFKQMIIILVVYLYYIVKKKKIIIKLCNLFINYIKNKKKSVFFFSFCFY